MPCSSEFLPRFCLHAGASPFAPESPVSICGHATLLEFLLLRALVRSLGAWPTFRVLRKPPDWLAEEVAGAQGLSQRSWGMNPPCCGCDQCVELWCCQVDGRVKCGRECEIFRSRLGLYVGDMCISRLQVWHGGRTAKRTSTDRMLSNAMMNTPCTTRSERVE